MKHRASFTAAIWWVLACMVAGIFLMVGSDKESRISETENRMLQGFPELSVESIFNDEFTTGFEAFLTDAFFGRDEVISLTDRIMGVFSRLTTDDILAMQTSNMEKELQTANLQVEDSGDVELTEIPGVTLVGNEQAAPDEPEEEGEEAEIVILAEGEIPMTDTESYLYYEMKNGTIKTIYTYEKGQIDTYAETLRIMQGYLPADGQILFTQVPLASIANRWVYQQDSYAGWGSSVEKMLTDSLMGTERIHVFSTYDILEPYVTGETYMFYRTDHHWSAEGAYKVCAEMLKAQGLPVIPYEEYQYKAITSGKKQDGYRDTYQVLYPLMPAQSLVMEKTEAYREIDLMNYETDTYRSFMNNTRTPWRKVITGANTGRKALILCDSFGNAFAPYLLPYYDEVHMADFRNGSYSKSAVGGSIGEKMMQYGIDDVYIITSTANGLRKDNSLVWLREYLQ